MRGGYDKNSYLLADCNGRIIDGGHRLSLALIYGGQDELSIGCYNIPVDIDFGYEWFYNSDFTKDELSAIREVADELTEKYLIASVTDEIPKNISSKNEIRDWINKEKKRLIRFDKKRKNGNSTATLNRSFYQSFPRCDIKGVRPTDTRIQEYGLAEELSRDKDVLDIGSNQGFMDLTIAEHVRSITGIEYNLESSNLSREIAKRIQVRNATFVSGDFKLWIKYNTRKYDLILSFAVHNWIGLNAEDYANSLNNLLKIGGRLYLESHSLNDNRYETIIFLLQKKMFIILKEGEICDDGLTDRKWILCEKTKKEN